MQEGHYVQADLPRLKAGHCRRSAIVITAPCYDRPSPGVAMIGPLKLAVSGLVGLALHPLMYIVEFENRLLVLLQWRGTT